jgi:hypothetical protein
MLPGLPPVTSAMDPPAPTWLFSTVPSIKRAPAESPSYTMLAAAVGAWVWVWVTVGVVVREGVLVAVQSGEFVRVGVAVQFGVFVLVPVRVNVGETVQFGVFVGVAFELKIK